MQVPGIYMLMVQAKLSENITVGKLGTIRMSPGWYCYVGSAMGGVSGRLQRHLSQTKKLWWHIDYMLKRYRPSTVIWAHSEERFECAIAQKLTVDRVKIIPGFGSSDCRCPSHLFFDSHIKPLKANVKTILYDLGLVPRSMSVPLIIKRRDLQHEVLESCTKDR
ncbi:GIY-YIG nuclease family protein [SAR202 cluster bacterium AD-804-J14_MRT_500m]|nr:GIY-YIG nuclease family protein [SAR202 cluster bacterium AD-804-J14_MRT_500m]